MSQLQRSFEQQQQQQLQRTVAAARSAPGPVRGAQQEAMTEPARATTRKEQKAGMTVIDYNGVTIEYPDAGATFSFDGSGQLWLCFANFTGSVVIQQKEEDTSGSSGRALAITPRSRNPGRPIIYSSL